MKGIYSTFGLVWSRIRFDGKRHLVAGSAVMILMASFLTLNAVATGLDEGIHQIIEDGQLNQIQLSQRGFAFGGDAGQTFEVSTIAAWAGVTDVSARSAEATGIEVEGTFGGQGGFGGPQGGRQGNITQEIVLVHINADAESGLVEIADTDAQQGGAGRGFAADTYQLTAGQWIEDSTEAVITQGLTNQGYGLGQEFALNGNSWTIVGVIQDSHPASIAPSGVFAAGHVIVDGTGGEILGAFIQTDPDFFAVQSVTQRIIDEYPQSAFGLEAQLQELESQHFDAASTQAVLSAAARLVGAAGVATVFAMSLFLLIGERKSFGTMASLGFTRPRLGSYMNQKMLYVAVFGALAGGALGGLLVLVLPAPEVSFTFEPVIDAAGGLIATAQTLAAAILGSILSFLLTIRKDPIEALRATE